MSAISAVALAIGTFTGWLDRGWLLALVAISASARAFEWPTLAALLPNLIPLVCFTDTYVIKAVFHAGPETKADDVLYYSSGPFFPATDAEIYAMRPLSADLGGEADMVFIHKSHVRTFYPG